MKTITREEAIKLLALQEMAGMSDKKREAIILSWWSISEEDPQYGELSEQVREDLKSFSAPHDCSDESYDIFIILSYREQYRGVKNSFMTKKLGPYINEELEITGEEEQLEHCNCCSYRTIEESGAYEICPVCFWEDDGICLPEAESEANGMKLQEGRDNFEKYGACSEMARNFVSKDDPAEKYFE